MTKQKSLSFVSWLNGYDAQFVFSFVKGRKGMFMYMGRVKNDDDNKDLFVVKNLTTHKFEVWPYSDSKKTQTEIIVY